MLVPHIEHRVYSCGLRKRPHHARGSLDGKLKSPAYITAVHNGILILNHFELKGDTPFNRPPEYTPHADKGPISIQDHGNPVRFRNIWIREFKPAHGEQERDPFIRDGDTETPIPQNES